MVWLAHFSGAQLPSHCPSTAPAVLGTLALHSGPQSSQWSRSGNGLSSAQLMGQVRFMGPPPRFSQAGSLEVHAEPHQLSEDATEGIE